VSFMIYSNAGKGHGAAEDAAYALFSQNGLRD
jgi:hypothetical protein